MFQPRAKLEFIRRYLCPDDDWEVFVDIDASEEGRTGGPRVTPQAIERQQAMIRDAQEVRQAFAELGVTVGGNRRAWFQRYGFAEIGGDHDVIAFHLQNRFYAVAEVEGESSGQPEQKLYKAIGQIVMAASAQALQGWNRRLFVVISGDEIANHLARATALDIVGVAGVSLNAEMMEDRWLFGGHP